MLDVANQHFHPVSLRNKVKIHPVNDQLNDQKRILNKQRQK